MMVICKCIWASTLVCSVIMPCNESQIKCRFLFGSQSFQSLRLVQLKQNHVNEKKALKDTNITVRPNHIIKQTIQSVVIVPFS